MSYPTLEVSLALTTRPTETPTWTDITDRVLAISTARGRENEFAPMGLGTARVVLDNYDRRFDPAHDSKIGNYIENPSAEVDLSWWQGNGWTRSFGPITNLLTQNESFETSLSGWGWDTWLFPTRTWSATAYDGEWVARVYNMAAALGIPGTGGFVYNITISGATLGRSFSAQAQVRAADAGTVGHFVNMRIYEIGGATGVQQTDGATVSLTTDWQRVSATHTCLQNDRTIIQLRVVLPNDVPIDHAIDIDAGMLAECVAVQPFLSRTMANVTINAGGTFTGGSYKGGACFWADYSVSNHWLVTQNVPCSGGEMWLVSFYWTLNGLVWERMAVAHTTDAAATWLRVDILQSTSGLSVQLNDSAGDSTHVTVSSLQVDYYLDAIQLEPTNALQPYCDGDQPFCSWLGVAHNSRSQRNAYGDLLKPMRRLRIRATTSDDVTHDIFYGYVDGWPQTWDEGITPLVNLRAGDGFKILAKYQLNESFAEATSDVRVDDVLDAVGWTLGNMWVLDSATNSQLDATTVLGPGGDRALATGDSTLQAETVADTNALQYLQDVADSEYGLLFIGRDGVLYFRNRRYSYGTESLYTFGDAPGELGYADYQLTYDDEHLYNDVRLTRVNGAQQTVSDTASQLDYFRRTLQNDRLLLTTDSAVSDRAYYLLGRYKEPHYRSPGLTVVANTDDALLAAVLTLEIGHRITVIRRPQGGIPITIQYRIEGVEHTIGAHGQTWETCYRLSTADAMNYWMVCGAPGDEWAAQAVLGTTTILAY